MKLIVSLIILVCNILCVYSDDISTYATINNYKQNSFKKGDDITITCDLGKLDVINVTMFGPGGIKFFVYDRYPSDGKTIFPTKKAVSGSTSTTEVPVGKEGVSAVIKNATDNKVESIYLCEVIYKEGKDVKSKMSKNNVEIKFWDGNINDTGISIYSGEKKNVIKEFKKGDNFTIECSPGKVTKGSSPNDKLKYIKLLQNGEDVVNFDAQGNKTGTHSTKNGIITNDMDVIKYGIHVHKAHDKIKGTYQCQYLVEYGSGKNYTIGNDKEIKYKNYGLKIHLSAGLIIMSLITMFK